MRVISGKAKGKVLIAPEGFDTRPITAMMKEALFSMWQFQLVDSSFLDLFAGSGSMGIEAISRGAKKVVFVEKAKKACDVIKKNLKNCNFTTGYNLYQDDVFNRVQLLSTQKEKFDIIYMDPPFTVDEIFIPVLECVAKANILNEDGVLAIRSLKEKELPEEVYGLTKYKVKTYGISTIHFYCNSDELK